MKKIILIILVCLALIGCKKNSVDPQSETLTPTKALLIFPHNNSDCNLGEVVNTNESKVLFEWEPGENTDAYDLNVTSMISSETITVSTKSFKQELILRRGEPYTWFVISKSLSVEETAKSDVWSFYNAGLGTISHIPFPAELLSPEFAEVVSGVETISLNWNGQDLDEDIISYDVYYGTTSMPPVFAKDITNNSITNIKVEKDTIYYWMIITRDASGNISRSEISQFRVE